MGNVLEAQPRRVEKKGWSRMASYLGAGDKWWMTYRDAFTNALSPGFSTATLTVKVLRLWPLVRWGSIPAH